SATVTARSRDIRRSRVRTPPPTLRPLAWGGCNAHYYLVCDSNSGKALFSGQDFPPGGMYKMRIARGMLCAWIVASVFAAAVAPVLAEPPQNFRAVLSGADEEIGRASCRERV